MQGFTVALFVGLHGGAFGRAAHSSSRRDLSCLCGHGVPAGPGPGFGWRESGPALPNERCFARRIRNRTLTLNADATLGEAGGWVAGNKLFRPLAVLSPARTGTPAPDSVCKLMQHSRGRRQGCAFFFALEIPIRILGHGPIQFYFRKRKVPRTTSNTTAASSAATITTTSTIASHRHR